MTAPRSCPADLLAGLVDGELGHAARERVQRHLVDCAACRAERAAQADLKALLRTVPTPAMSDQLTARLLALAAPGAAGRDGTGRAPARSAGRERRTGPRVGRPAGRRPTSPRRLTGRQRLGIGSALVVLSFGAAFALGAPRAQSPVVRLDPGTDVFVADYARVTGDVPVVSGARSPGR